MIKKKGRPATLCAHCKRTKQQLPACRCGAGTAPSHKHSLKCPRRGAGSSSQPSECTCGDARVEKAIILPEELHKLKDQNGGRIELASGEVRQNNGDIIISGSPISRGHENTSAKSPPHHNYTTDQANYSGHSSISPGYYPEMSPHPGYHSPAYHETVNTDHPPLIPGEFYPQNGPVYQYQSLYQGQYPELYNASLYNSPIGNYAAGAAPSARDGSEYVHYIHEPPRPSQANVPMPSELDVSTQELADSLVGLPSNGHTKPSHDGAQQQSDRMRSAPHENGQEVFSEQEKDSASIIPNINSLY